MRPVPLIVASWAGPRPGAPAIPYALAVAAASGPDGGGPGAALLLDLDAERRPRPALLAGDEARALRELTASACGRLAPVARGRVCACAPPAGAEPISALEELLAGGLRAPAVVNVPPPLFRAAIGAAAPRVSLAVLQADRACPRAMLAIAFAELRAEGIPLKARTAAPGWIQARRALAGLEPGGATGAWARRALAATAGAERRSAAAARDPGGAPSERGQALPLLLGLTAAAVLAALALVALGGAATAKGRAQRAVDLAALSAARSMRDDLPRLLAPAATPGARVEGLGRAEYLGRAVAAARQAARRNGLPGAAVAVRFEGERTLAPLRVSVRARPRIVVDGEPRGRTRISATAALEPPAGALGPPPESADGGDYSGPLAHRQGEPMRPDVAAAFDRLAAAAARAGHVLVVNSAFRSDAEQARLFAANPDPRWVAPPGRSLHRCGTELDLGPASAHGWLAARAERFGFVRRYPWEPWHYGFVGGPPPCSAGAGAAARGDRGDGRSGRAGGLPGFVPPRFRAMLSRAAAAHDVSARLLAAQLLAESRFDPDAVSAAGARGIAQFMPATAAAYGLADPFDPEAAIDAQARLMADLLERFGSPRLALAAYNAGPAPVAACGCVPPYPETRAYVARIVALLPGLDPGAAAPVALEVRLVE